MNSKAFDIAREKKLLIYQRLISDIIDMRVCVYLKRVCTIN